MVCNASLLCEQMIVRAGWLSASQSDPAIPFQLYLADCSSIAPAEMYLKCCHVFLVPSYAQVNQIPPPNLFSALALTWHPIRPF